MKISPFSKRYQGEKVLDFPGMELEKGRIYAVIGSNGSGKSTFARIISGIEKSDQKRPPVSGCSIGYMPQKSYAFRMSVEKNLLLNGGNQQRAQYLLEQLQISHIAGKSGHRLSGGETAKTAFGRLFMRDYDLLILDEPTAAIDMETTIRAEQLMVQTVQEKGCILILVTHSLQQAKRVADEILLFDRGKLVEWGSKEEMIRHPREDMTKQFFAFYGN